MVLIGAVGVLVGIILNILAIQKFGLGLPGVAMATSIAHFFYATVLIVVAFRNYTRRLTEHIKFLVQLYSPFVWVAILLFMLQGFTFKSSGNIWCDLGGVFLKGIIFLLFSMPLVYYANKKTGVLSLVKEAYARKHKKT